ncbi:MAG TPA: SgcJ/EcaC family oxidoreductase [Ktedonobacterales bacterium]|nr:SgcJ/EcaC family oxidoreductase [Ktedonobacterales bacterium]
MKKFSGGPVRLTDDTDVRALYARLTRAWNSRDAMAFAACFIDDGYIVGYDGSVVDGRDEIRRHIGDIFAHHQTPAYITKVKRVLFIDTDISVVRGIVGMPSLATGTLNPVLNSIQSLTAHRREGAWHVATFQNTPAQFHGRPDLVAEMTEELQAVLDSFE